MVGFDRHPLLTRFGLPGWALAERPPTRAALQTQLVLPARLKLVDPPSDGLHYEQRIATRGEIATRADSWHDAFNALMWSRWPLLKAALNRRQAADLHCHGPQQRSRAQMAITHFDESGVIVVTRERALLEAWARHDWAGLFVAARAAWSDDVQIWPVGHALLEHLKLEPHLLLTAKAIAVQCETLDLPSPAMLDRLLATAMDSLAILADPQHPRPLPVSGIPAAWHPQDAAFYADAPCFRPLRPGRIYAEPLRWCG